VWYLAAALLTLVARARGVRWVCVIGGGVLGFALGALPVWIYNLQTGGATFRFIVSGSQGQTADRGAVLNAWWNNDLPRGAGLWHPWGPSPHALGELMAVGLIVALLAALFIRRHRFDFRPLDSLLALLLVVPVIFAMSGFGGPALNPYGFDATGRYTSPIWSALTVVLGWGLAQAWRVRRWLGCALALVPLAVNGAGILSVDPVEAFQSPYWDRLPADNTPLLDALRVDDVQYVWMNHWAGQPAMFDARAAGQNLVAYDWYDVQAGGIDRFPEYLPLVRSAARPAFVLVTDEAEPELERTLHGMGVAFEEQRVPPYVIVIPTSRVVDPSEVTPALHYRY
jgi:hypothetical protein